MFFFACAHSLTAGANATTRGKALASVGKELGTPGMDGFRPDREAGHIADWGQGSISRELRLATSGRIRPSPMRLTRLVLRGNAERLYGRPVAADPALKT